MTYGYIILSQLTTLTVNDGNNKGGNYEYE